jgi:Bacterial Ig domain
MPPRFRLAWPMAGALTLLLACEPTITNRAAVYPPISGSTDVKLNVTATGVSSVEFTLDGQPVGTDTDATDGFAAELDSTKHANGLHVLKAIAKDDTGAVRQTIEHTLLFQN